MSSTKLSSTTYTTAAVETVATLLIVLYFSLYGAYGSIQKTLHGIVQLVADTWTKTHVYQNYYGLTWLEAGYSVRLILLAVLVGLVLGLLIAILRIRTKRKAFVLVLNAVSALLEAIPEPMYVILLVLLVLFLHNRYGVNIPAFPFGDPTWKDTVIPVLALGLPSAFYLQRVLYLRLREEQHVQYVTTATSKGASQRQVFYRHILANVLPSLVRQIPVLGALVLSSVIFAEFFLNYQGLLFYFTQYGVAWNMSTGAMGGPPNPTGSFRPGFYYEPGVVLLLGLFLVVMWLFFRILSFVWQSWRYPQGIPTTPAGVTLQTRKLPLFIGAVLLSLLVIFGLDPKLVTNHNPSTSHLANYATGQSAPFPPSLTYPLGTNQLGQDLLSQALYGTLNSLIPVALMAGLVVLIALILVTLAVRNPRGILTKLVTSAGRILSAIPALFILFLAMYHRNLNTRYQILFFVLWIVVFELGRAAFALLEASTEWFQFGFIEGALSIGKSRARIFWTDLRPWVKQFSLEYGFSELARGLSIMTQLAAFHIYAQEHMAYIPFEGRLMGIQSAQLTWFSMLGDVTNNFSFTAFPYFLYAPVLALLIAMIGANLMARGLRGDVHLDG